MKKMQIAALFVYMLSIFTVGDGLLPLLPLYAEKLGADPSIVGYYLAFSYLALAAGALSASWLSDRKGRMAFLYIGYLIGAARVIVMAFSSALWHFWVYIFFADALRSPYSTGRECPGDRPAPASIAR